MSKKLMPELRRCPYCGGIAQAVSKIAGNWIMAVNALNDISAVRNATQGLRLSAISITALTAGNQAQFFIRP